MPGGYTIRRLLLCAESTASGQAGSTAMASTLVDPSDHDMIPEDNPEAVFDFLTIQSLKGRYGNTQGANQRDHNTPARGFQSETDFETYVQQFPIDDTISQCFATAGTDSSDKKPSSLFLSGGKRPDPSSQKLRKKFGRKPVDEIDQCDDTRGRDPKRSKPGGVLGKRHKWLSTKYEPSTGNKRHTSSSDQSETDMIHGISVLNGQSENHVPNDSNSNSDSQITSFSEVFMRTEADQVVPNFAGNAAATSTLQRPGHGSQAKLRLQGQADAERADHKMDVLITGDSSHMIQQLEDLSPNEAMGLRDQHGNTLLHRCVLAGSEDSVKYLLEKYPEMSADINVENLTAVELSAKIGNYDCLKVMLERNQRRKSLGPSLLNRLLTVSSQYGQVGCLNLLLQRLSSDPHCDFNLPRDPRGNTVAHLAAKQGHLNCLQSLVAAGFDVSSENMLGQTPLRVAHQSRHQACFEYLLLLHIAQDLLHMIQQTDRRTRSDAAGSTPLTESILDCFQRFNDLCAETQQMLAECKVSIMQTLDRLQHDLELFIRHTATDSATKRQEAREKLEELAGEIERLEDTLEFSPLLEKEGAMSRLLASVNTEVAKARTGMPTTPEVRLTPDNDTDTVLRSIIRDTHKEFLLENWSVDHVYSKYLGGHSPTNSPTPNPTRKPSPSPALKNGTEERPQPTVHKNTETAEENGSSRIEDLSSQFDDENSGRAKLMDKNNKVIRDVDVISDSAHSQSSYTKTDTMDNAGTNISADDAANTSNSLTTSYANGKEQSKTDYSGGSDSSHSDKTARASGQEDDKTEAGLQPTERPFTKLLSLDERIDLLIAGERAREKISDTDTLVSADTNNGASAEGTGSVYTTTFTSITSDSTSGLSEWYTKLGLTSLESSPEELTSEITSDSASYWWDQGNDRQPRWTPRQQDAGMSTSVKEQIRLQLESEDTSYEELRRQRLISHLRAVEQSRLASDNFCERITTSTGEVMGGFGRTDDEEEEEDATGRIVVDVTGALRKRPDPKPVPRIRGLGRQKLFTLEDAIATNALPPYNPQNHGNASSTMKWEDMSFTDEDEESISWYEMEARNHNYYRSGTSTSGRSTTPQSYV